MTEAESAAKALGLPFVARQLSKADVAESLDHVLWLIEEPHPMKVSVAMAVYWIARTASENDRPVVLLGQGSDELFGGYRKFATILGQKGSQASLQAISESIRRAHEVNYQRDEQAVSSLRAELRLPFATRRMVGLSQRVPLEMKVRSPSDGHRKWILREAAIALGVPSAIAMQPKRAIQYASGVDKAIREIAKKHQLAPSTYLERKSQTLRDKFCPH
jgi:asparagine synthetase B (glutamine-hydrolysing)